VPLLWHHCFIIEFCLCRLLGILGVIAFEEVNLEQIKKDHSHLQELIVKGFFTPEEARTLQNRNFNSRAPENDPTLVLDIF
jgi:serine/threonine protein phosphatase PrpC